MANLQSLFGDNVELTASINKTPFTPGLIATSKIFSESGTPTTSIFIEFDGTKISLVPAAPRGGVADTFILGQKTGFMVEAVHLPVRATVMADAVQDQRGFGGVALETPEQLKTRKLSGMRANLEATIEYHRLGAIKGQILDSDGITIIADLYSEFGISQVSHSLSLDTVGSNLLTTIIAAERLSEDALGGTLPRGFLALAAPDLMDALRNHPDYKTELQFARPSELSADYRTSIVIGNTTFVEYRTPPGGLTRIEAGTAYLLPMGIPDLFKTAYAPADYMETVNTPGLPIYLKAEMMDFDKGATLEAQSNPVSLCTQPACVIKLTA
ncbi:MAG: major capsid protein [Burkholderiaceae bacterium]